MPTQKTSHDKEIKEIWKLFRENREQMRETDRRMRETDRKMQETDRKMEKTREQMQETDRQIQKNSEQIEALTQRAEENRKRSAANADKWGELMEALTTAGLIKALNKRGIKIINLFNNCSTVYKGVDKEFDIIAVNGKEVVAVEAKVVLRKKHIKEFLKTMKDFKKYFPVYSKHKIYGAMAYLKEARSAKMAEQSGLFLLTPEGHTVEVKNAPNFKPKPLA